MKYNIIINALLGIFLLIGAIGCQAGEPKNNQCTPLLSPSGKYNVQVTNIQRESNGFSYWWCIKITDSKGNVMMIDDNRFPARFNIYWSWDRGDRIWFYNSDDGSIYYWGLFAGRWIGRKYEGRQTSKQLPDNLLPTYAR